MRGEHNLGDFITARKKLRADIEREKSKTETAEKEKEKEKNKKQKWLKAKPEDTKGK